MTASTPRSPVVFEDIHFAHRDYEPWLAYGQSKTANVLFAVGITQRWADDGIVANALHPGGIRTNLHGTSSTRSCGGCAPPPAPRRRGRARSRVPRPRSCWPPRRWSRA
jgi:NAD(P)-dependent dehydrogenase (short-subunit alcohol dehydrogenase family)